MFIKGKKRTKTYLKQNFKQLIDILRTKTVFKQRNDFTQSNKSQSAAPAQSQMQHKIDDIVPVTMMNLDASSKNMKSSQNRVEDYENKSDIISKVNSPIRNQSKQSQSVPLLDNYSQYEEDGRMAYVKSDHLKPDRKILDPILERKVGSIIRRNLYHHIQIHRKPQKQLFNGAYLSNQIIDPYQSNQIYEQQQQIKQPRYIKKNTRNEFKFGEEQFVKQKIKFKEIEDLKVIQFWNDHDKINDKSSFEQLSAYFQELQDDIGIEMDQPVIKKYKNCIYFGDKPHQKNAYQGFITYFDNKIYYGEFKYGFKNGHGVQINFNQHSRFAGTFSMGKKTGYFQIQKLRQNYQGYLLHGMYQGKGKLITEDIIYTGQFENGKKHGYGEQYNIKTGLRLAGIFKNGQYQNLTKSKMISDKSSEPQLHNKLEKSISKKSSVQINFQIQKKFKKDAMASSNLNKSQLPSNHNNTKNESQCYDSQSLFDLINNTKKQGKYDFCYENIIKRMPKIKIQGIQHKYYDNEPDKMDYSRVANVNKQMDNPQEKVLVNNRKSYLNRPLQYQNHQIYYQDNPLTKHKMNSPLKSRS